MPREQFESDPTRNLNAILPRRSLATKLNEKTFIIVPSFIIVIRLECLLPIQSCLQGPFLAGVAPKYN